MDTINKDKQIFESKSGKKEEKGAKKDTKMGWYIFLFMLFLACYAFFTFVVFK